MKPKEFDAVNMMRDLRDELSRKYARLTLQEEIAELQYMIPSIENKKQQTRQNPDIRHHQTATVIVR